MSKFRHELPTQQEVANYLKKHYPEEEGEDKLFHDRWGLYSNNPSDVVKKILLVTTPTRTNIQHAIEQGYDLVIGHHDFLINKSEMPQIIYHSSMDISPKGHNWHFVNRLGLKNVHAYHKVVIKGDLYKPMTIDEFKNFLNSRGFDVNGMVWKSGQGDDMVQSVVYCSGGGGYLMGPNHIFDITKLKDIDVYVTGELSRNPNRTPNNFKYVVELGHTASEKPLFKWIRLQLLNRWSNLEVDVADTSIDRWSNEVYQDYQNLDWDSFGRPNNTLTYPSEDYEPEYEVYGYDDDDGFVDEVIDYFGRFLQQQGVSSEDIVDIEDLIVMYYSDPAYNIDIILKLREIDSELAEEVETYFDMYFPEKTNDHLYEARLNLPIKKTVKIYNLETKQVEDWPMSAVLDEINRDHSDNWTDYNESDWVEGWDEWVEGEFYSRHIPNDYYFTVYSAEDGKSLQVSRTELDKLIDDDYVFYDGNVYRYDSDYDTIKGQLNLDEYGFSTGGPDSGMNDAMGQMNTNRFLTNEAKLKGTPKKHKQIWDEKKVGDKIFFYNLNWEVVFEFEKFPNTWVFWVFDDEYKLADSFGFYSGGELSNDDAFGMMNELQQSPDLRVSTWLS